MMLWRCSRTTLLLLLLADVCLSSVGARDRGDAKAQNAHTARNNDASSIRRTIEGIQPDAELNAGIPNTRRGYRRGLMDNGHNGPAGEVDAAAAAGNNALLAVQTTRTEGKISASMGGTDAGLDKDLADVSVKGAGAGSGGGGMGIDRAHRSNGGGGQDDGGGRGCLRGNVRPSPCRRSHRPPGRSLMNGAAAAMPGTRQPHNSNAFASSAVRSADAKAVATRRRTLQAVVRRQRHGIAAAAGRDGDGGGSGGGGDIDYRYGTDNYGFGVDDDYAHAGRRAASTATNYNAAFTAAAAAAAAADDVSSTAKPGTADTAAASGSSSRIDVRAKTSLAGGFARNGNISPYRSYITDKLGDYVPTRTTTVDPEYDFDDKYGNVHPFYMDDDTGSIVQVLGADDGGAANQQQQQDPLEKAKEMQYILYDVLGDESVFAEGPDSVATTTHDGHLPGSSDNFPYGMSESFLQQMYEYLHDYTNDGDDTAANGVKFRGLAHGSATAATGKVDVENDTEKAAALELWQALYDMFGEDDATFGPLQETMYIRLYEQDPTLFWAVHDEVVERRVGDRHDAVAPGGSDSAANLAAAASIAAVAAANGGGMVADASTGSMAPTADKAVLGGATPGHEPDSAAYDWNAADYYYPLYYDEVYESEYDQVLWGKEYDSRLLQDNEFRQQLKEKDQQQQQQQPQQQDVARRVVEASAAAAAAPAVTSAAEDRTGETTIVAIISADGESVKAAAAPAVGAVAARDVPSVMIADDDTRVDEGASAPTTLTNTTTTTVISVTAHGSGRAAAAAAAAAARLAFLQAMSRWNARRVKPGGAFRPFSKVPGVRSAAAADENAAGTAEDVTFIPTQGAGTTRRGAGLTALERSGTIVLLAAAAVMISVLLIVLAKTAAVTYRRGRLAYACAASPNQLRASHGNAAAAMIHFVGVRGGRNAGRKSLRKGLARLVPGGGGAVGDGGGNRAGCGGDYAGDGFGDSARWHHDDYINVLTAPEYRNKGLTVRADARSVRNNCEAVGAEQQPCNGGGGGGTAALSATSQELSTPLPQAQLRRANGSGLQLHDSPRSWISPIPIDHLPHL
ncbi:hypothetical protein Vretifemale_16908 [Volvox reticuliferus]|nr:hypothetical protein Vretifemale_16908 [Volvox reticuliferus]